MNQISHGKLLEELRQLQDKTLIPQALLLTVTLAPLNPLEIVTLIAITIPYKRYYRLLVPLILTYIALIALNLHIQAVLLIFIVVLLLYIITKKKPSKFIIGLLIAGVFSTYMLAQGTTCVTEYVKAIRTWIACETQWYVPMHLTLVMVATTHIVVKTSISKSTKVAKYIEENPGAPPIIFFIILLLAAATVLALGSEKLANKLAEIAYYNLVLGVVLQLVSFKLS